MDKKKQDKTEYYNIVLNAISRQDKTGREKKAECLHKDGKCEVNVPVIPVDKKTEEAIMAAGFTLGENISFTSEITPFDIGVMAAVCSICEDGTVEFTNEDVVRSMRGNTKETVNEQTADAVAASIRKLRHVEMVIGCTEEYKKRKNCESGSFLLPVNVVEVEKSDNTTVSRYRLLDMPALYKYTEQQRADCHCTNGITSD